MKTPFDQHLKCFLKSKNISFEIKDNIFILAVKDTQYENLPITLQADIEIYLYNKTKILANASCKKHNENIIYLMVSVLNPIPKKHYRKCYRAT